jgi:diacylglycerol kinase family enzyme
MARIALLSNPRSTGNRAMLPRVRSFCAEHPEIFHYEVEAIEQIGPALQTIARVQPLVLVVNGGDGTVQATLTELYHGGHFGASPPPVAVLPNGKTNLIALDLGYPLGLPNGLSHVITLFALVLSAVLGIRAAFLPARPSVMKISLIRQGQIQGHFSLLIVTTLQKMLMGANMTAAPESLGALQLMVVEQNFFAVLRAVTATLFGRLGSGRLQGVHVERGDEIRIEGERASVILDGEIFHTRTGRPIVLRHTNPVPFLRLAA